MERIRSADNGRYVGIVSDAREEKIGSENNIPVVKVYFRLTDSTDRLYGEKAICIFQCYDEKTESAAYKLMVLLDELEEDDIDCARILKKAQGKKFIITIGEENGYKNIVDIKFPKKKKPKESAVRKSHE